MLHRSATAAVLLLAAAVSSAQDDELRARGEYLIHAGGCLTCHTEDVDDAASLAGGYGMESPYGTFFSPNITPDRDTGIGAWSDDQFVNAFWEGEDPDGNHYFPAFPFTSYTGVSRDDLLAMKAYLFSLEPVSKVNREHDLVWYASTRFGAGMWKRQYFVAGRFTADESRSEQWNRGAYLVRHLGHCGECHTPRTKRGEILRGQELMGSGPESFGDPVPNITTDEEHGVGKWSESDLEFFLEIGMLPDGDFSGGSMTAVIEDNTSKLTKEDRQAIVTYLKTVSPSSETDAN